jgi:hypothetical protein
MTKTYQILEGGGGGQRGEERERRKIFNCLVLRTREERVKF